MPCAREGCVLLLGLDPQIAAQLAAALNTVGCRSLIAGPEEGLDLLRSKDFGLVFCASDPACYLAVLRHAPDGIPVVIASRIPEVSAWLDAMDEGAADYCAAPFEPQLIRWVIETNLPLQKVAAAN